MIEKREKVILVTAFIIWSVCKSFNTIIEVRRLGNIERSLLAIEESVVIKKGGVDDGN
jgi:hypothetical protein